MKTKANTQYGKSKISNEVVVRISELAAMEVPGISAKNGHLDTNNNKVLVANRFVSPIKAILKGDAAEITLDIIVISGYKAAKVAEGVQQSVKSAIQSMTGIAVSKVNIRIVGVRLPVDYNEVDDEYDEYSKCSDVKVGEHR